MTVFSEDRLRALLHSTPDALLVMNLGKRIILFNRQAERQFGYREEELVGQPLTSIIPDGLGRGKFTSDAGVEARRFQRRAKAGFESTGRRRDGSEFPLEAMISQQRGPDGTLVIAAIRDVSARKETEAFRVMALKMAHSALHDELTGLPNRTLLNDRIEQSIARAARNLDEVAVLVLDLDGFKHLNDSLGHSVGDRVLRLVAGRLTDCVKGTDTVSRQGGDEFTVLLSEAPRLVDVAVMAKRMLDAVAGTHAIDGGEPHVTASIGVSIYPDDGLDAETLIKNADTAMYQAKETGRNSYKFFTSAMNVRAVERQSIEEGLRRAVDRQEFVLHYQPKVDLRTGSILGAEALVRWTHPTRGQLSPQQFIPVAEDCGLMVPLGQWVLRRACEQVRDWADRGMPRLAIAVNVSATELREDAFLDGVLKILNETGIDPSGLELELTESILVQHAEAAASVLQALRKVGVHVSVDDFGTGYSSLSYLQQFPIDSLKVDQSFVRRIAKAGEDEGLVAAVIRMARSLNLRVVAEGVETAAQLAFLRLQECDEAQGFYFSRPLPPERFATLMSEWVSAPVLGL